MNQGLWVKKIQTVNICQKYLMDEDRLFKIDLRYLEQRHQTCLIFNISQLRYKLLYNEEFDPGSG